MADYEDHFTIFIRLPFARGEFIDPPPVAWSAAKERELWEVLSKSSKGHEIDWRDLSARFKVTQAFLLQQAAWLYERQLSQVRAQMRRMGNRSSTTSSPLPLSNAASVVGAQPMKRTESGGSRVPSRLSAQVPVAATDAPGTPNKGRSSFPARASSQAGTGPAKNESASSRPLSRKTSKDSEIASRTHSRRGSVQHQLTRSPKQEVVHEIDSSSEEEMTQSRMLHRRPNPAASRRMVPNRKSQHARRPSAPQLDEEDEEDSPAFLPFSNNSSETATVTATARVDAAAARDPSATIRIGLGQAPRPSTHRRSTSERITPQQTKSTNNGHLTSSNSSASEVPPDPASARPRTGDTTNTNNTIASQPGIGRGHLPNPLSPRQQAALAAAAGLSPRLRRQPGTGGHGSDTSPSMGSSFSDLDDASVTQSALEEALLSGMGNTTMTMGGGGGPSAAGTVGNVANRSGVEIAVF
ncbi:hypothetical protein LTR70_004534 [Exophiala xenobiotica]|uniref:Autophagy-related protein 29 n=1 Tax=Lithohypha guttulata TaxID=1690604 RepID=A0ABR0KNV2_9EURO|nr:hypothetical protein LTR24_000464 [Lithohypha guttulata]KAK5320451.1 hypothetical protein LTR70_004534 [Exophiala xenobiotica]